MTYCRPSIFILIFLFASSSAFAQVPASQEAGAQEALRQQREISDKLQERILQPIDKEVQAPQPVVETKEESVVVSERIIIDRINVSGNTILPQATIDAIITPFQNKEISIQDMQKITNLITDAYRKKGFVTSRAILPPQDMSNHILEIKVIEGRMGVLEITGNHYFKKKLFTKNISLKRGDPFNYNALRNDLRLINQSPDRVAKVILSAGKEPGETDALVDIKDELPIHVGMSYNNYGSRYTGASSYIGTIRNTNTFGFGDTLSLQYQLAEMKAYRLNSVRYSFPISKYTEIGAYGSQSQSYLKKELRAIEARGKSKNYGIFVKHSLVNEETFKVSLDGSFDYKDIFNFQLGRETNRDRLRILKGGFNIDFADQFNGRNIVNNETSFGIPDFMAGLNEVDRHSSRVGAGGKFSKNVTDLLRLQRMPWETNLLIKVQTQLSSTILPAPEQYQLGGSSNVRGFAPGEAVGDSGESVTAELTVPAYPIPKWVPIPFSKAKLYDSVRLAGFFDWGHVNLRNPQVGESKNRSIDSLGVGFRLNLPENFSLKLDFAWPVKGRPSDENHQHTWMQISKEF